MIRVEAPAKLNFSLRVGSLDRSGFHPIQSRVQTIDWYDYLSVEWWEDDVLELVPRSGRDERFDAIPTGPKNLVWVAAGAFWSGTDLRRRPARVRLEKHIPAAAGLAGGSADAAAMATGLAALTGRPIDHEQMVTVGSDVAFSLLGGSALMEGYGEQLTPIPAPEGFAVAVAVPPIEMATPQVYHAWDLLDGPVGIPMSARHVPPSLRSEDLINDLYPAALSLVPELGEYRSQLEALWGRPVAMSGSGPSLFAFFADRLEADEAAAAVSGMRAARSVDPVDHGARVRSGEHDYNDIAPE